jgi:hypothetical protein
MVYAVSLLLFYTSWISRRFSCCVHGFAKFYCTGKGGDGVDVDAIPLRVNPQRQLPYISGPWLGAHPHLAWKGIYFLEMRNAAFCSKNRWRYF